MIYILHHADVSIIVVEDQEQVDKILEMWDDLKGVRKVIFYDPKGLRNYTEDFLMDFTEVEKLGREYDQEFPEEIRFPPPQAGEGDFCGKFYHPQCFETQGLNSLLVFNRQWQILCL